MHQLQSETGINIALRCVNAPIAFNNKTPWRRRQTFSQSVDKTVELPDSSRQRPLLSWQSCPTVLVVIHAMFVRDDTKHLRRSDTMIESGRTLHHVQHVHSI